MFLGAKGPVDRIAIKGKPDLNLVFEGGVVGDEATVGMILSAIPSVLSATPGLKTMMDIPLVRFRAWD
jgi:4-hydroxy-tetrahydrodipicolinate reductase